LEGNSLEELFIPGLGLYNRGEYPEAVLFFKKALRGADDRYVKSMIYNQTGWSFYQLGDKSPKEKEKFYKKALLNWKRAEDLSKINPIEFAEIRAFLAAGLILVLEKDEAKEVYEKYKDEFFKTGKPYLLPKLYNSIGLVIKNDSFEEALDLFAKAYREAVFFEDFPSAGNAGQNVATILLQRYRLNPNKGDLVLAMTGFIKALLRYPVDQEEHIRNCKAKLSDLVREGLKDSDEYDFVFPKSWDIEIIKEGNSNFSCQVYGHMEEYFFVNRENIPAEIFLEGSLCGQCGLKILYAVLNEV
jgi:tetratricopeptide (TPR) repeat protein